MYSEKSKKLLAKFVQKLAKELPAKRFAYCQKNLALMRKIHDFENFYPIIKLLSPFQILPLCQHLDSNKLRSIIDNSSKFILILELMSNLPGIRQSLIEKLTALYISQFTVSLPYLAKLFQLLDMPIKDICELLYFDIEKIISDKKTLNELILLLPFEKALEFFNFQEPRLPKLIPDIEIFHYYLRIAIHHGKQYAHAFIANRTYAYFLEIFHRTTLIDFVKALAALDTDYQGACDLILDCLPHNSDSSVPSIETFSYAMSISVNPWHLARKFTGKYYRKQITSSNELAVVLTNLDFENRVEFCQILEPGHLDELISSPMILGQMLNMVTDNPKYDTTVSIDKLSKFIYLLNKSHLLDLLGNEEKLAEVSSSLTPDYVTSLNIIVDSYTTEASRVVFAGDSKSNKSRDRSHSSNYWSKSGLTTSGSYLFNSRSPTPTPIPQSSSSSNLSDNKIVNDDRLELGISRITFDSYQPKEGYFRKT